eukprot:2570490-Lingulodinium_polyedra.AAC.1
MASAGCFPSLCTCAWRLPDRLSQDNHTLHFQRRTFYILRARTTGLGTPAALQHSGRRFSVYVMGRPCQAGAKRQAVDGMGAAG